MSLVYPHYFADPFVWRVGNEYFAVGTGHGSSEFDSGVFPLLRSNDLTTWEYVRQALPRLEPGYGDTYWAPEVAAHENIFYLYYSVGFSDRLHHLRVALSRAPDGPYEDTGAPLTDPSVLPFAIDAHPFRDEDGTWHLFYARDFLDMKDGMRPGTGLVADRLRSMTELAGEEKLVARARHDWQLFIKQRVMYGRMFDWHTLEGPCVRKFHNKYYCLYSGGCWENDTYGVDYVSADSITGPYLEDGGRGRPRVLESSPSLPGPGHVSLVRGPDENTDYIVYHAWDSSMTRREMHTSLLEWTLCGPKVRELDV